MWIYILNVLLIILYNFVIKNKKIYVIVCSIQCFMLLALRSNLIGPDASYYYEGYKYISGLSFIDMVSRLNLFKACSLIYPLKFESGFVIMNWIVSHLGFSYHFFLVICAAINMTIFGKVIYKYSKIPWLSFVVFCTFGTYLYFFGILRQSLALCFFMLSFMYALEGKTKKSAIMYFITFLFHRVSIVLLPILFLVNSKTKISKRNTIILVFTSIPFIFVSKYLIRFVQSVVNYFNGGSYVGGNFGVNKLLLFLYVVAIMIIIFINFKKHEDDKLFNILVWILIISIFLDIMGQYNEVWERSVQLYTSFLILLIPYVVYQYRKQKGIILVSLILVLLLIGYMCYYLKGYYIIPYEIQKNELIFPYK